MIAGAVVRRGTAMTGKNMNSMRKFRRFGMMAALAMALGACGMMEVDGRATSSAAEGSTPAARGDLGSLTYRAVDLMLAEAASVPQGTPVVVASVGDIHDLNKSSPLGNMVSDLVRTRLVQSGANVSEMRMRSAVGFSKEGEMMLSRQLKKLTKPVNAGVVVAGTYAAGYNRVYVSLKMVSVADGRIIAGADYSVPRGGEVEGLIRH